MRPSQNAKWGRHQFSEYFTQGFMGMQQTQPKRFIPGDPAKRPALAVEVTGTMASAYPKADPAAKPAEKAEGEKKDEAKPAEAPATKTGVPSPKPVRVIVVADTDFIANGIFELYRNAGNQLGRDELAVLRNLRNVQFIANAVDALAADQDFLSLRTRRPQARPLSLIQDVITKTDEVKREMLETAANTAEIAISKAQGDYAKVNDKIDAVADLDENAKAQLKANKEAEESRKLQKNLAAIEYDKDVATRDAEIIQDQTISRHLLKVKWFAVGIPACVMLILVLAVGSLRLRAERSHIPASRKRSQP
jgi:ABC-type uncharacterized transport system involved in gliding motility auxiliary subunit